MSFGNIKEETYCDIFSSTFDVKLNEVVNGIDIDKHIFKEFLIARAKNKFMVLHSDWVTSNKLQHGALNRILELNIKIDCARELPQILKEYEQYLKMRSTAQSSKRINKIFSDSIVEEIQEKPIDKKCFRGGQTILHVEACRGTLEGVKNLVEVERARTDVKDNSGMTPYQIAFQMGREDIAAYLKNFAM
jgi:hypothetical protein